MPNWPSLAAVGGQRENLTLLAFLVGSNALSPARTSRDASSLNMEMRVKSEQPGKKKQNMLSITDIFPKQIYLDPGCK